nr:MAG TPA_asm: hypothetical protein [Caudoviricetes sp.]
MWMPRSLATSPVSGAFLISHSLKGIKFAVYPIAARLYS